MERWLLPRPFPDELFSGWLVRSALTLGCDPLILTGELWPRWRPWILDIDRGMTSDRMQALVRATGFDREVFESMMVLQTAKVVAGVTGPVHKAVWPWILTLGTRNRKRSGGLQYCPHCFKKDRIPYYRRHWRFAWHTGCPEHEGSLVDRCCACHAPLEPHRLDAMDAAMTFCSRCRHDLRRTETDSVYPGALKFQSAADEAVRDRQGWYGDQPIAVSAWFELSRFFIGLLRRASLGTSMKLQQCLVLLGVDISCLAVLETGLALEMLPVHERSQLFAQVWPMIQAGPSRFVAAVQTSELLLGTLNDRRFKCPVALKDVFPILPNAGSAMSRTPADIQDISPRSQRAVMRMMARLQRKYHGLDQ